MTRRLVFLASAEADLKTIFDLIAADSPTPAFAFVDDVRGRLGGRLTGNIHRFSLDRRVTVLYRVGDTTVAVARVTYLGQT